MRQVKSWLRSSKSQEVTSHKTLIYQFPHLNQYVDIVVMKKLNFIFNIKNINSVADMHEKQVCHTECVTLQCCVGLWVRIMLAYI